MAVLGLLFATTIASVTHSIAMPMAGMEVPMQAEAPAHHHKAKADGAPHDHGCDSAANIEDDPVAPAAPCENGCLLCKSCSLASAVMPAHSAFADAAPYRDYRPAAPVALAEVIPTLPNEPPRS